MFLKNNGIPLWEMHGTSQSLRAGAQGEPCTHQKKRMFTVCGGGDSKRCFPGQETYQ